MHTEEVSKVEESPTIEQRLPVFSPELSNIDGIERGLDKNNSGIDAASPAFIKSVFHSAEASFKIECDNFTKERDDGGIVRFNSNPPERPDFNSNLISSEINNSIPIEYIDMDYISSTRAHDHQVFQDNLHREEMNNFLF